MGAQNKAIAATLVGALATLFGAYVQTPPDVLPAAQTALTAILVWLIPNTRRPRNSR